MREVLREATTARTLALDVPDWPGQRAGQHLDLRLTADDGYQAQRSYSIASAPELEWLEITVEVVEDGEVSPYLADEVRPGDRFEVRGPIGGHFTWSADEGGPLLLVAGGSGLAPLMAMLRHRAARGSDAAVHVLISARSPADALYGVEIARLSPAAGLDVTWTWTRAAPEGWAGPRGRVDAAMLDHGLRRPRRGTLLRLRPDPVRRARPRPPGCGRLHAIADPRRALRPDRDVT